METIRSVGCSMKNKWIQLLNYKRFNGKNISDTPFDERRNPFVTDHDRIVFSSSFRRLGKKTQVHPLTRNDHIHNRLTHSMEVACVARSIAIRIGYAVKDKEHIPDNISAENFGDIAQAACLAHDIGNPPFGHAGESAIQDWFSDSDNNRYVENISQVDRADFQAFDGNAQGFRVVTALENNKDRGGLRLTCATLGALVKYPNSAHAAIGRNSKKFNFYQSEKEAFDMVFSDMGLVKNGAYARHPLSYITEAADDICYRIIDMEDARELKIISFHDMTKVVEPIKHLLYVNYEKLKALDSDRRRASFVRTQVISAMIDATVDAFVAHYDAIMSFSLESPLIKQCDDGINEYMQNAKSIFNNKIKNEPQKMALEIGSYSMYKILLDVFIPACSRKINKTPLSYRDERALDLMGVNAPKEGDNLYKAYLRVIDFITGMTDAHATFISEQFSGTGTGR